ncbi:3-oxoadipate enol-lactonase [Caballeronia novacaledonica]|jgi:3-oxoadipate enol-lactonase|uniref:3-oxoadipate enol-lactonase n=1 Tax=Caballeronia novacaledonica TaxID=1544861 RepID=UPI001EE2181D|nr:3-oxoadipate enol-lactonase [Caballeronia novacaledonica]GJH08613.1 3-oxoadipate enol-lactonase [Caballeronia novacaledonica]
MPLAEVNGTRIHYRIDATAGDNAPWLVLSNSLGADVSMWTPNIEAFAKHYRVVRYDTRGHGHSDVPPGPYTIDQLIGDVIGLMDHLKIERANYCGLSMGGLTGIGLAARHPERFSRVVLSNTAALIGSDAVWTPRAAKAREPGGMPALTDAVIARWFTAPFIEREQLELANIRDVFRHTSGDGYASNCEAIRDADLRDEAKTITLPVLVIAGTHDLSTTAEQGRELAGYINGSRYLELDAAHLSNIEKRDDYTRAVLDFIGEQQ